jgi:hypothetical protein
MKAQFMLLALLTLATYHSNAMLAGLPFLCGSVGAEKPVHSQKAKLSQTINQNWEPEYEWFY